MRRIVALASLFGFLFNCRRRDKEMEMRLSKALDLASNSGSLTLPMVYHEMVWSSVERRSTGQLRDIKKKFAGQRQHNVSNEEAQSYASVLVGHMPTCLFYDTAEVIKSDLIHLFESIPFILGEQKTA